MAEADEDFEAMIEGLAPILLPRPGTGMSVRGVLAAVTMMAGLGMGGGGGGVVTGRCDRGARGILLRGGRGRGKRRVSL